MHCVTGRGMCRQGMRKLQHLRRGQAAMHASAWLSVLKVTKTALRSKPEPSSLLLASCMKVAIFFSIFLILCWCASAVTAQHSTAHGTMALSGSIDDTLSRPTVVDGRFNQQSGPIKGDCTSWTTCTEVTSLNACLQYHSRQDAPAFLPCASLVSAALRFCSRVVAVFARLSSGPKSLTMTTSMTRPHLLKCCPICMHHQVKKQTLVLDAT